MRVVAVRPLLGDLNLAKLHLHHRTRIFGFGRCTGFHVVDLGEHAIFQLRIHVGMVALLLSGCVSRIRVSRIRILLVVFRIVGICGIAWLDFEGNVDDISLFCDDAIRIVERHRHGAIAGIIIDTVCGLISAHRLGNIAVRHRHISRDVGAVGYIREIDRIHPLGQGVGDGEDLDLRRRGNGGINLVECFRQILSVRAVKFLAVHCTGLIGEISHLLRISGSLHHIECSIATPVSFSQGGSIVITFPITATCTMHTFRRGWPAIVRIASIPPSTAPNRVIGYTVRRIAIRQEDDVLLHTRATL